MEIDGRKVQRVPTACSLERARMDEFTFLIRPEMDYIDTQFSFRFTDGECVDFRLCDLDFIPDDLIEDVADWLEYIETYKNGSRKVWETLIYLMQGSGDDRTFLIRHTARHRRGGLFGRFTSSSEELDVRIKAIILRIWDYAEESYGYRNMEAGVWPEDVEPAEPTEPCGQAGAGLV